MFALMTVAPVSAAATSLKGDDGAPPSVSSGCGCRSAGDCTCKKGTCKCAKCGGHHHKLIDSLRSGKEAIRLPETARRDASAGVFI